MNLGKTTHQVEKGWGLRAETLKQIDQWVAAVAGENDMISDPEWQRLLTMFEGISDDKQRQIAMERFPALLAHRGIAPDPEVRLVKD